MIKTGVSADGAASAFFDLQKFQALSGLIACDNPCDLRSCAGAEEGIVRLTVNMAHSSEARYIEVWTDRKYPHDVP